MPSECGSARNRRTDHGMVGANMIAYLDTEFTDLVARPRLLSVGIVGGPGVEPDFYAEVTDPDRVRAASWFAMDAVLPQFGKVASSDCIYAELGVRLAAYLGRLVAAVEPGEQVEVAYGYHLDWELVEEAIKDSRANAWEATRSRIRTAIVYEVAGFGAGKLAADAYYKEQEQAHATLSRHHALCDARALRVACEAADKLTARALSPSSNALVRSLLQTTRGN